MAVSRRVAPLTPARFSSLTGDPAPAMPSRSRRKTIAIERACACAWSTSQRCETVVVLTRHQCERQLTCDGSTSVAVAKPCLRKWCMAWSDRRAKRRSRWPMLNWAQATCAWVLRKPSGCGGTHPCTASSISSSARGIPSSVLTTLSAE
jgi:hypothetical protein